MNRGLSVIDSFRALVGDRTLTEDEVQKAHVLGWCVEWLQAYFLVADDIMDQSVTRRGEPCWYKVGSPFLSLSPSRSLPNSRRHSPSPPEQVHGVGNIAINDSYILESCIYKFLKKYFREEKYYVDLLEILHEVSYQTQLGQLLDLITAPEGEVDLNRFSMAKYKWIVKYKTAYYSFYLPVALAMFMAGHQNGTFFHPAAFSPSCPYIIFLSDSFLSGNKSFALAEAILLDMGEYFQVQDDYLDCFGDPKVIGKIGTDIQDNKCSWLVNKALEIATDAQKKRLRENYGIKDPQAIAAIKGSTPLQIFFLARRRTNFLRP